jgi:hypothetical protein
MSDLIYYKNGEETFRISPPTVGTKCPETKLEVKKMDELITLNLTLKELQQIDKYIEVNDDTLSVLMKIKDAYPPQKSPVEEAYKEWMGEYPPTTPSVDNTNDIMWRAFQIGWMKAQSKNNEPYCPDEPLEYDEVESDIDENKEKPKTLYSIIDRWWMDVFCGINKDWDMETSIEDLVDRIEFWNMRIEK